MSDITIKEASTAKTKAEQEIREILNRLGRETGAVQISTSLRCINFLSIGESTPHIVVERFEIRLEI